MAQQGGTWIPAKTGVATRSSSHDDKIDPQESAVKKSGVVEKGEDAIVVLTGSGDEGKNDGQQWEVVGKPKADNETDPPGDGMQSHFDFKLGWGKWKFTVFSWDLNIRKSAGDSTQQNE